MDTKPKYKWTEKLLPEMKEASNNASVACGNVTYYLYHTLERKWNVLTPKAKAYVMMYRDKFEELFIRPEPWYAMTVSDRIEYKRYRYEHWQNRNKLRHMSYSALQNGYIRLIHDSQTTPRHNPNDPDLGVSQNQYVIQARQEHIFECKLFEEHVTQFYEKVHTAMENLLKTEEILEINADPAEERKVVLQQGHKQVGELTGKAYRLFDKLRETDLKGAPQQIIDFVEQQYQQYNIRFNACLIGVPRLPRDVDVNTFCKLRDKTIQEIKDFMRKFILDLRVMILKAAGVSVEPIQHTEQCTVDSDNKTTPVVTATVDTRSRDKPKRRPFRFKF